jgi:hypothetical protein
MWDKEEEFVGVDRGEVVKIRFVRSLKERTTQIDGWNGY